MAKDKKGATGRNEVMTGLTRGKKQSIPTRMMIVLIQLYQYFVSPLLGNHCRFQPTCSHYFIEAISRWGFIRGSGMGAKRISKCHPFHRGGYDPVTPQEKSQKQETTKYDAISGLTNPSDKTKDYL